MTDKRGLSEQKANGNHRPAVACAFDMAVECYAGIFAGINSASND
jgi:hypothetical protein